MVQNKLNIEIERPVDVVFSYVDDDTKLRQWIGGIVESSRSPGPPHPGTSFRQVIEINGKPLELLGELTRYERNRELAVHMKSKLCDMDVVYGFEARAPNATMIRYVCDSQYHNWFFRLIGPLLKPVAQKKLNTDFKKLKDLLEAPQPSESPRGDQ